jgi:hypothetical protein
LAVVFELLATLLLLNDFLGPDGAISFCFVASSSSSKTTTQISVYATIAAAAAAVLVV